MFRGASAIRPALIVRSAVASEYEGTEVAWLLAGQQQQQHQQGRCVERDADAERQALGKRTHTRTLASVLCKSERSGIVCTIASGRHKGKGFLINRSLVRQLGEP